MNESTSSFSDELDYQTITSYLSDTSFEFNINKTLKSTFIIDLKPLCSKLVVITYKLISIGEPSNSHIVQLPIKCECYKVDQSNKILKLKKSSSSSNNNNNTKNISSNPQYLFELPSSFSNLNSPHVSNSLFKRMFQKRSKSTSLIKNESSLPMNSTLTSTMKLICFDELFTEKAPNLNAWKKTSCQSTSTIFNLKIHLKKVDYLLK